VSIASRRISAAANPELSAADQYDGTRHLRTGYTEGVDHPARGVVLERQSPVALNDGAAGGKVCGVVFGRAWARGSSRVDLESARSLVGSGGDQGVLVAYGHQGGGPRYI